MDKIKLIIADDQLLFLKGLRLLINTFDTITLVAEAQNGKELLEAISIHSPDVVLIDLKMPVMDGIEATKRIREENLNIKIILLSMYNDESIINLIISLGANGYLIKNEEPHILKEAIESVMTKDFYFNDYTTKALLNSAKQPTPRKLNLNLQEILKLTSREVEVLKFICKEYTSAEIANELYISIRTVEGHRKSLLQKTNVRNTVGLVMFALKNQIVDF